MKLKLFSLLIAGLVASHANAWSLFSSNFDPNAYGTIVFGVDAPYPPYAFTDSTGKFTGFEVELGNKACEYINAKCEWLVTPWDTIIDDLNTDKFDIIMSSMSVTKDRAKRVDFGDPYYATPAVFFARKGENIGTNFDGRTIAVQRGTLHHEYVVEKYSDSATIMALDDWDAVNAAFRAAEANIVFTDYPQWEGEFFLEKVYEILGTTVKLDKGIGLAFRQGDDELRKAFNEALDELKNNGQYERIRRRYFFYRIMVK